MNISARRVLLQKALRGGMGLLGVAISKPQQFPSPSTRLSVYPSTGGIVPPYTDEVYEARQAASRKLNEFKSGIQEFWPLK